MEVNFKELKRKDLQRLCKKHGLRANATNSQMADSLVSYFKIYEKNEQVKVRSKGLGGSRNSKVERVEGDAEKVIIVIDEDEDENGSVLQSANRKSSPKSRCSSQKDEQIEARLDDSSECGNSKGTGMKWHEENAIILLDEEDDKPCDVTKSADGKKSRRSIGRLGKACEANRSNEENQAVGVLRKPKEGLLVPVRTTRSRSTNSAVAQSPVVEKAKARKERLIAGQNAEPPLGTNEGEDNEIGKMKENPSLMMAVGDARVKRKRNSRNSSMKVDDEIMASLPIEVSVTENFVGDAVYKKHVNTGMGSAITFSIDGEQVTQGTTTRNEQEIKEHELSTSSNLMEEVAGSVQTKRGKKRTRAGLEEDSPVMEKEIDQLGNAHHSELSYKDEMLESEACFALSQTFGTPSSFNLASSRPRSLLSELQGGEDGGQFPINNEQLSKQSGSLDRNGDLEIKESLVCKNSILASITMVVVDDGFVRGLSTSELDHVSKDGEASRKSSATALSYSQGRHDIKEYFCSSSENHVRNLEDSCNKCFNVEAHQNRCCAETPILMNNLSSSSEQNCATLKFAGEVTAVEATQECQDFDEVRGSEEGKKRNKLSKDHEAHKEKENGENNSERITRHCDFEKASPVILRDESMIEDIRDISDPASERTDEMTNSAFLSVNIDGHNDHNLFYLAENSSERVEECQIVVQKQFKDFKTLFDGCGASSEDNSSNELEYFAETLEKPGLGLLSCKFQEQAADYGQAAITRTMKVETDSSDMRNKLELQELIVSRNLEATRNTLAEEKIDSCQVFEVEQESEVSQSSGEEIIDPQNLIVSHITDVSTIVCDHLACSEFDAMDAEGIKERDISENRSASPNRKMLSDCKALLNAEEMEDVKFLKTKPSHGEPLETEDDKVKENGSNLYPNGSDEKKNTTNFIEFESFNSDSPRLAESNSGQFFAPFESVVFREEHQIKGGGTFKLEGNVPITQAKLKHYGEKLRGSEKRQATGYDEDIKGKIFAVSPPAKVEEIAPFGLSKRVDNLMEKLFCLKKVLRGEIAPLITDSSLPREEEISCEDSHPTRKKEMTSEEPFSAREQESLNAFTYTDPVHEDCEQDGSNSEVNIPNKFDQVATTSSPLALNENPELWKGMTNCEGNDTDEASPYEYNFYIRPTKEGPFPDGDVDVKEFLENVEAVTAKPGEVLLDNNFVSPGKLSSFDLEAESSIASSISKSPAIYVNPFGTKCLSETSVVHSSLPNKKAYVKHAVDILKMESHDKVAKTTLPDALEGNLELWKCSEKCEANNTNAASSYESDCSYNGHAEAEPCQGGDINVRDFLENAQGATSKPSEALEKIDVVSPSKQSRIALVSEKNSTASCSPVKYKLHNNITNSPAKDTKHFRNHCLSEALDGQTSLIIKEALATPTVDVLKTESPEVGITSLPDALEEKLEFSKGMESCVANNIKGDDIAIREFDDGATTRPGDVLAKIKFLSPSKRSSIDLEDERNLSTSCIWKKAKLNSNITNGPARDTKHFGTECLYETLDENPELWKGMESCEGNYTEEASPYECNFYIRPSEEVTCPDGDVDVIKFLETVQGVTAKPGQVMVDNNYVSPGKPSTFELEAESSIGSCISKSKVNNSITNCPAIYVNPFGTKCLAETSVLHSSLPNKQAYAKHTVDILRMESHDKVAKTTLSDALEGNLELWKSLEKCEASNTNAASSYESDRSYNGHAAGQGGDVSVRDFLENAQGATSKLSEALEKIDVVSPSKQSRIDLVSERNSSASCSPVKSKLHNSITNSPVKDTKHFRNHGLSEALDGQTSVIIKEALATHTIDALKTESPEVAITSLPDALEEKLEFSKGMESCVANNIKGDDIAIREFDQGATTRPGDVLAKIKFLSPSKRSSIDLEDERNLTTSCIWKKAKLNSNITNSPARDTKHFGTECLYESQDGSIHGADTLVHPIPSEVKDPLEEISQKSVNFCISSRKFAKSNILNTPTAHPAGISSVGLIRDENNTQNTKKKFSSKGKIRNSASAGSIRRPLQTVTNRMNE
ncbi:hypothetical protein KFK09_022371 [Dendrobium nobile]|uniref:SAP domain-containing protein n=1 Tax=Dendrobium nobile TaxID=94219 RepID=A0A8T3AJA2_DENNO|nr:hypothetical protein KFK09_022371 [Dendrobium nobile]